MSYTLGELLVKEGIVSAPQLTKALELQKKEGKRLGETLVGLGFISRHDLERFFKNTPPTPKNVAQTGIKPQFLVDLLLKIGHVSAGIFTIPEMSEKIKLPPGVTDELVEIARAEKLVAVRSAAGYSRATHVFEITPVARERLQTVLMQSSYAGPAPVPLRDYNLMVARQSIRQVEVDASWVRNSLRDLVVNEQMISQLGPAFNSGRSIFLYGPAGTGKSTIAEMMSQALPGEVFLPYAIEVSGQVLRVHDASVHIQTENVQSNGSQLDLQANIAHDPRWVQCKRPVVMVGGELAIDSLDLDFDPETKIYEVPVHIKAANGVFILDDFGRQLVAPRLLLNRWIVPLERGTDFLTLHTGSKFEVVFDQITIFCTNMRPSELVDEAFLRRIRHKIKVGYHNEAEYIENLRRVCAAQGIRFSPEACAYLLDTYYKKAKRPLVGCHPRDLVDQILDRARFTKIMPQLDKAAIDAAAANYFVEV